ncbi:MAG: hypothetical protein R2741_13975 [Methanolobus sp.]
MNNSSISAYIPPLSDPFLQTITVIMILFASVAVGKVITIYLQRSLKDKMDKEHLNILL